MPSSSLHVQTRGGGTAPIDTPQQDLDTVESNEATSALSGLTHACDSHPSHQHLFSRNNLSHFKSTQLTCSSQCPSESHLHLHPPWQPQISGVSLAGLDLKPISWCMRPGHANAHQWRGEQGVSKAVGRRGECDKPTATWWRRERGRTKIRYIL